MPTINIPAAVPELHLPESSSSRHTRTPSPSPAPSFTASLTANGLGSGSGYASTRGRARASSASSVLSVPHRDGSPAAVGVPGSASVRNRSRANSAASMSLAAALASGAASPPRPMSPALLSPPLRASTPLPHPIISIPPSKRHNSEEEKRRRLDINAPPPAEDATGLRQAAHYAGLVLAAMLGTLIRLGLDAIGTYNGRVIFPLAWSQGVGCGIMGIAVARKNQLYWWYPPLHTFIGTGIAGSVTTFSSWMLEGFLAFANFEGLARGGFYDTVDGVAYSLSTLAISVACLYLGYHVSSLLPTLPSRRSDPKRTPLVDCLFLLSAVLSYLVALLLYFLGPTFWRHRAIFALLLAPPGAMLRYLLALLNSLAPVSGRFPLGTFMANMTATLIIAGVYAAQHRPPAYSMPVRCDALYALQQGFCGCLSTVSTFAFEITTLTRRRWRWIYLWTSVVLGHIFVLAVLGGVKWGEGIGAVCTGSDGPRSVTGTPI